MGNLDYFFIQKWTDESYTIYCCLRGKGFKKKHHHSKMMENLRNFPTEVAGRAIRLHRWRLGCFNTKKLEIFLSPLVVFSFFFRAGHNRRRTKMRDENHHGQQGPPLVTVALTAYCLVWAHTLLSSNLLLHISFLRSKQLAHPAFHFYYYLLFSLQHDWE